MTDFFIFHVQFDDFNQLKQQSRYSAALVIYTQIVYTTYIIYDLSDRKNYMNFIVLDLEWNQCPSGKEHEIPQLPFEIIEIGAVKLNEHHQPSGQFHEVIKPQAYKTLHYRTKELVQLCETDFQSSRNFSDVIKDFFDWCGDSPLFCTWGPADLLELQRNLTYHNIDSPFPFPLIYYDIQKIFSIIFEDRKSRRSLEYAVDFLNIPKPIPFHSALSDALYTAKITERLKNSHILKNSSVDYYRTPANRRQEIHLHYPFYEKFVSKPFDTKTAAMKDRVVTSTVCRRCHRTAQKKIRWFPVGSKNYYCLSVCEKHGYLKGKIRIRQNEQGQFYAIKTLKLISPDDAYEIIEKKEIQKLKRRLRQEFIQKNKNAVQ